MKLTGNTFFSCTTSFPTFQLHKFEDLLFFFVLICDIKLLIYRFQTAGRTNPDVWSSDGQKLANKSLWATPLSLHYVPGQPVKHLSAHESPNFTTLQPTVTVGYCSHCLLQWVNEKWLNWTQVKIFASQGHGAFTCFLPTLMCSRALSCIAETMLMLQRRYVVF